MRTESGQASLEAIAAVPALVLAALVALQLLATAYTVHLADGAAEAGALAAAAGGDPAAAARAAMPGWAHDDLSVSVRGGRVEVTVAPPAPSRAIARALTVESRAWARPAGG